MQTAALHASIPPTFAAGLRSPAAGPKELFRAQFMTALTRCVRRGFCVEECFGMIWEETLEEVEVDAREQGELYAELIEWARGWQR